MKLDIDLRNRACVYFHFCVRKIFVFILLVVYVIAKIVYFRIPQTKLEQLD